MSALCVLSGVLGNRIFSSRLAESVERVVGSVERVWLDASAYAKYPAPALFRSISALESELVARRMLAGRRPQVAVVNGYTIGMATRAGKLIVATDATPAIVNHMRAPQDAARRVLGSVLSYRFARFARRVDAWLPICTTVRDSLVNDYGVNPARCFVTRAPQAVIHVDARRAALPRSPELLFVGNDFARKGGPLLLEARRAGLLNNCALTVVSNDQSLAGVEIEGVRIVRGINNPAQISDLYRRATLLVLPTTFDMYPNVICEALAHGLPFVATRVGGIGEMVDDSGAGWSVPQKPSAAQLAEIVQAALSDEAEYVRRSAQALRYAAEYLSLPKFDACVRAAIEAA